MADKCIKKKVFDQNFYKSQEPRAQPLQRFKNTETSGRLQKDHKNNKRNRKVRFNLGLCKRKSSDLTLATRVNTTNSLAWKSCDRPPRRNDKDLSQVTCYNYNKKGYFANQYTKPHKPKN